MPNPEVKVVVPNRVVRMSQAITAGGRYDAVCRLGGGLCLRVNYWTPAL